MAIDVGDPPVEEVKTGLGAYDAVPNAASGSGMGTKKRQAILWMSERLAMSEPQLRFIKLDQMTHRRPNREFLL